MNSVVTSPYRRSRPAGAPVIDLIILNVFLFGVYTNIFLYFSETLFVPNVIGLVAATLILLTGTGLVWNRLSKALTLILLFLTLNTLIANSGLAYLSIRMPSLVQMWSALIAAHLALLLMLRIPSRSLEKVFLTWTLLVVIGCVLEVTTPLRDISDWFRELAFTNRWTYDAAVRDLEVYGRLRPNLFTQEPSHVSKAFVALSVGWYLLSSHRYRLPLLVLFTAILVVVLRGPFVILAPPLALVASGVLRVSGSSAQRDVLLAGGLGILALTVVAALSMLLFPGRWNVITAGEDLSLVMRFSGPFSMMAAVLADYPTFGIGLGAKEFLWPYVRVVFGNFGSDSYLADVYLSLSGNGLANSVIYFGIAGAAIFYGLVWRYFRTFSLPAAFVGITSVLIFFNLDGSIEGVRTWGYIIIVTGAFLIARRQAPKLHERRRSLNRWVSNNVEHKAALSRKVGD